VPRVSTNECLPCQFGLVVCFSVMTARYALSEIGLNDVAQFLDALGFGRTMIDRRIDARPGYNEGR
jgi:hypothetical protein